MTPDPWQIGRDHEQRLDDEERAARGAWYTPRAVVDAVVALAIDGDSVPSKVIDPACGGGAFLLGTLDRLVSLGVDPAIALRSVSGTDVDPGAVAATNEAIAAWAAAAGIDSSAFDIDVSPVACIGDALDGDVLAADDHPADLLIGNPPFATPLRGGTFPSLAETQRRAHPERFGPYADLAAIHLAAAIDRCADGGRVAFVLPQSLLSARDVAGLRAELEPLTRDVWATTELVFDANVRVWAPVVQCGSAAVHGDHGQTSTRWSPMVAVRLGAPAIEIHGEPLAGRVEVVAGFRDEFYALAAQCREGDALSPELLPEGTAAVVTVGSIDPLSSTWGSRPIRFDKRDWDRPIVTVAELDRSGWLQRQLVPKILLPTQSKILEPVIDRQGRLAPVTPLLAVMPGPDSDLSLDHLAAMLLAPPISLFAFRTWFGSALSVSAIKLSAPGVRSLPTPSNEAAWSEGASLVASSDGLTGRALDDRVTEIGAVMAGAYDLSNDQARTIFNWWDARRADRRASEAE